jgi:ABC-2 type transport system permease protein
VSAFLAVVKKEINSVIRDRTIGIALVLQLFIASFSSALLIGMLSLYDPDTISQFGGSHLTIGLVGPSLAPLTTVLSARGVHVAPYPTLAEAEGDFFRNKLNAIISLPADSGGLVEMNLYLPRLDASASLIRNVIQQPLTEYENYLREQRGIGVRYTGMAGKPATAFEFIYSVILPMLMFFPAFVAGSMMVDSLSEEVENNTLQTLLSAPLSLNGLVGAKITSAVFLAVLQCSAWLGLLMLNRIHVQNGGLVLLLAAITAGITAVGAGLVAVLFKDRERSQFVYSLSLLALIAFSTLLDVSPVKTLSRLAIGDPFTNAWTVAAYALFLAALLVLLSRLTRRLAA